VFKSLSMLHVSLAVEEANAPRAAWLLASYGVFSPEHSAPHGLSLSNPRGQRYRDLYFLAQSRVKRLADHYGGLPHPDPEPDEAPSLEDLEHLVEWLGELENIVDECEARKRHFQQELEKEEKLLETLAPFKSLNLDLSRLATPRRFLETRAGTLPESELDDLLGKLDAVGALYEVVGRHNDLVYLVLIAPKGRLEVFKPLAECRQWHDLVLPPEFRGPPQEVEQRITDICKKIVLRIQAVEESHRHTLENLSKSLSHARRLLELAEPYAQLSPEIESEADSRIVMNGWIPAGNVERLKAILDERLDGHYTLTTRKPHAEEHLHVPSSLRYPNWLGPFADLVRNYGIPCYGDFDPTLLFAVSFVLMFGMMFGDMGHGFLIVGIGFLLRGNARRFRPLFWGTGASSMLFGLLYGSVFGFETLIRPLWISPLHSPMHMLMVALWWGVGFILVTQLIYIRNRFVARDWPNALLGAGGIGGGLLYVGGISGIYLLFDRGWFGWPAALACGLGFLAVFIYNCTQQTTRWPERLFVSLLHTGESVIAYFSNTLSFMRVAAFSFNHAALTLAVLTLSEDMESTGRWIVIVIGNAVILFLEGAIVAIQVLRLEYYEGFSRLFTCQGREFKPISESRLEKTLGR
jgi:V/A-type H+-transporting ATPase subunit I